MRDMIRALGTAALVPDSYLLLVAMAAPQTPSEPGFIGNEICPGCHADICQSFYKTPHLKSVASGKEAPGPTGWGGRHGGGRAPVISGGGAGTIPRAFSLLTPKQAIETCLNCHGKDFTRANIRRSEHTLNDVP